MPELILRDKRLEIPEPATLFTDSIVYPGGYGYSKANPPNRLIHGENLAVMASLLPKYEGSINLIYADPPFFTNKKFSTRIGR